ncbi:MAG: hypothetical protein V8R61_03585 [Enterocloster sp.]
MMTTTINLINTIFAPNIKWEGDPDDPWGAAEGREAFIKLFKGFQKQMDGRCLGHNITNGCITFIDNTHKRSLAFILVLIEAVMNPRDRALAFWNRAIMMMIM